MAAIRKKRKPDAYVLNFVKSSGKRSRVKIAKRRVSCCPNDLSIHPKKKSQCRKDEDDFWAQDDDEDFPAGFHDDFLGDESPSGKKSHRDHHTRETRLSNAWEKLRDAFHSTAIENFSMPDILCVT